MSAELDMTQYLDLFLQEAAEQLEILEQQTLQLEADPTEERLQVIFRAAHTLKGSSRAMGFANLAQLTHEMENVLDQLRHGTLAVDTTIADALLGCQDTLKAMIEGIAAGEGDKADCSELVAQLQSLSESGSETSTAAAPLASESVTTQKLPDAAVSALLDARKEKPVYHAIVRLQHDCVMKFVRAFMAVTMIQEAGEVLWTCPEREKLEEEEFDQDFELLFHFDGNVEVLAAQMRGISEVERALLVEWTAPSAEPGQPSAPSRAETASPTDSTSLNDSPNEGTKAAGAAKKVETGQTVRVDVSRLDNLMNLVGELVIDRTRIAQIGADLLSKHQDPNIDALAETVGHIARITGDLQDQIMKARMMPIETVFNRFPRVVRDLAQKLGKEVHLELEGGDTELDRSVIEVIGDPLLHIIRNSVDHGLESREERLQAGKPGRGLVKVAARHQENHIVIEIIDDGKGIDVDRIRQKAIEGGHVTKDQVERMSEKEALQLIFNSGLSTATEVSEVSGRGVGMDIVRSNIQRLGGLIDLESTPGVGTRFQLRLPLTLAIIRGLLVSVNNSVYVLPLGSVVETLLVQHSQIQRVNKQEVIVIRGLTMPLVRLRAAFATGEGQLADSDEAYVVVVGLAEKRVGLVVDGLIGEQEVVIKSLSRFCGDVPGVSGATILGDGNVALIVDVNGIVPKEKKEKAWH